MFIFYRIKNKFYSIFFKLFISPFFGSFGKNSRIISPSGIEGIENIHIGNNVYIADGTLLATKLIKRDKGCHLEIKDECNIGKNNHIYATSSIIIEEGVLTANNVYISDNSHSYQDIDEPIKAQSLEQLNKVIIGKGCWLGQNVCIHGVKIGEGCTIGANSVVNKDIPSYCVAVGSPARIIKRYDSSKGIWRKTNPDGSF